MNDQKRYQPSNGSEGDWFTSKFCDRCFLESEEEQCEILTRTMIYDIADPNYPSEWVIGSDGPKCTAFRLASD